MKQIILAMLFLCCPEANADNGNIAPCMPLSTLQANVQWKSETVFITRYLNIFKAYSAMQAVQPEPSQQSKVLEHILKGKPCQTPGLIRYKNKCYTPEKLKLVKRP